HETITRGDYRPAAFQGFTIPKKSGGARLIAVADPRDHLVQKMLHTLLTPVFDRMFEECSIGFRRGRSRQQARRVVTAAVRQGFTHVLESDVESFFDSVDWQLMLERLANLLPRADHLTYSLLERFIKADLTVNNRPCPRDRGLIQGMVLAPLLANLFLDTFDEKMNALGYRMVRYGDDFLVLTRSLEEGKKAREDAANILKRLGLELKDEKTAVTALDAGFSFLGFDFGPELDEEFIDRTALRKTVFIRSMYAFAGIDSGSLIIRKGGRLITRLPMSRIGEIVIFGNNTVSARLLHQCSRENIPVSFCRAAGRYVNTLRPDSRAYFVIAARHARRFETTPAEQRRAIAGRIAAAKLAGYSSWFAGRYGSRTKRVCALLQTRINSIMEAKTVETVRGLEGEATGRIYEFLRPLFVDTAFRSARRLPRAKCDPWNVLTDFTSFLFFSKLNVLLRSQGLNPYLGFLHSHKDNYESLVCDLQEPFRARMDRFVLKTVNRRVVRSEHFEFSSQYKTFHMKSEGIGPFLEAFEREMNVRLAGDGGTLKQLLVAQVQVLRRWVDGKGKLFFYQPR
ncbi:MAG: CRISPR-associated endonuclease Cas1, partial [Desulfobacterales bacterium]|nr:CRISPR-associated endonuclease Cas1 [Desulfobacterales bacterium]